MSTCNSLFHNTPPVVPVRGVHLDLKGLPPPFSCLIEWVELFGALKFNAILVEWEDTFPWSCDESFRGRTVYTPQEIHAFSLTCERLGIEIIPLVQSLGHSENVLGKPKYVGLREVPERTDVFHPLNPLSSEIVRQMVDDVVALLPGIRRFHLGGDEAQTLGRHPASATHVEQHGKASLYLRQFDPLIAHLEALQIRPLFWHDEFTHWSSDELSQIAQRADLVVWGYSGDPCDPDTYHHRLPDIQKLRAAKCTLWAATAFKGADGPGSNLPVPMTRQVATIGWVQMQEAMEWEGIFATGWSRYTSGRIQTEPMEAALDSLVNTAAILHNGHLPQGGIATCEGWLDAYGKGDLFRSCKAAMSKLTHHANRAWDLIRFIEEQIANVEVEPGRIHSGIEEVLLDLLKEELASLDKAEKEGRAAFEGCVDDGWLDHYFQVRLRPIQLATTRQENRLRESGLIGTAPNTQGIVSRTEAIVFHPVLER